MADFVRRRFLLQFLRQSANARIGERDGAATYDCSPRSGRTDIAGAQCRTVSGNRRWRRENLRAKHTRRPAKGGCRRPRPSQNQTVAYRRSFRNRSAVLSSDVLNGAIGHGESHFDNLCGAFVPDVQTLEVFQDSWRGNGVTGRGCRDRRS